MVIPHYYVPFESGNIYVHRVTAPGNDRAVLILPGRSMSGRNFWHFDPGTGVTHAEQLAAQGVDVYMVDALGFGNSTGFARSDYNRIYFAKQITAVIKIMPEYNDIAALGFCNTTMVPLVLAAQGVVNRAVVMSPTVFDTTWCQQNPAWIRLWQRTATKSGYWSTSLDALIEQQPSAMNSLAELMNEGMDDIHMTSADARGFGMMRQNMGNAITSAPKVMDDPETGKTYEVAPEVAKALTRDYSQLMKAINNKKGIN